jgi:hypothetical protein
VYVLHKHIDDDGGVPNKKKTKKDEEGPALYATAVAARCRRDKKSSRKPLKQSQRKNRKKNEDSLVKHTQLRVHVRISSMKPDHKRFDHSKKKRH